MTRYTHPATGNTVYTLTTGRRQYIAALSLGLAGIETPADLAALGFVPYTPPEPPPAADPYPAWRDAHRAGLAAFRAAFLATAGALVAAGKTLPDPITFRGLLECMQSLPGDDWTRAGLALRCAYDEVLFACHGDPQTAYDYLPRILADEELV